MRVILAAMATAILAAPGVIGSNVYSYFMDADGNKILNQPYLIGTSNECIEDVFNATRVGFSQAGPKHIAGGPYCAHGFSKPGCNKSDALAPQLFHDVPLDDKTKTLPLGKAEGFESLIWTVGYCPGAISTKDI
ncbi:hypothetical protein BDU57DRAFT_528540 [Ampelomyces quisqualis]|uniref:Uncharacterized protein n=1 Tax=Ampelomyces quisqualis TaxID=50730 RepID=A0A6A5QRR1_AMPQU|nr:hypothetical protein BDU57DRAFT_528540 [Ampelomyces quisqualis]